MILSGDFRWVRIKQVFYPDSFQKIVQRMTLVGFRSMHLLFGFSFGMFSAFLCIHNEIRVFFILVHTFYLGTYIYFLRCLHAGAVHFALLHPCATNFILHTYSGRSITSQYMSEPNFLKLILMPATTLVECMSPDCMATGELGVYHAMV